MAKQIGSLAVIAGSRLAQSLNLGKAMSENNLSSPAYLTVEMAEAAVEAVVEAILQPAQDSKLAHAASFLRPKRNQCHVVVVVPGTSGVIEPDICPNWMEQLQVKPLVLFEKSFFGERDELDANFGAFARLKAHQLWYDRNDDRTGILPHLLYQGDTIYWGGVKRLGIVVTCSGIQPYIDKMISGMVADMLVTMAYEAWMTSPEVSEHRHFIGG